MMRPARLLPAVTAALALLAFDVRAGGIDWPERVLGVEAKPGGLNLITLQILEEHSGETIRFGSMGAGLSDTNVACVFDSRGLMLESGRYVTSFHGPV